MSTHTQVKNLLVLQCYAFDTFNVISKLEKEILFTKLLSCKGAHNLQNAHKKFTPSIILTDTTSAWSKCILQFVRGIKI